VAAGATAGAATTVSVFVTTFFVDLAAELIIPVAEEGTEDILRRTYCYKQVKNHFLFDYLCRAFYRYVRVCFYFEVMSLHDLIKSILSE
jgi:hypothetical protein